MDAPRRDDPAELQALLATIPEDRFAAFVLGDYLEECGDAEQALRGDLLRLTYALTQSLDGERRDTQERRARELVRRGVRALGPYRRLTWADDATMDFVWIPPGTFWMGSPESEEGRIAERSPDDPEAAERVDEADLPRHPVALTSGFWMGVAPVTQWQFATIVGRNPSWNSDRTAAVKPESRNLPVQELEWFEAVEFLGMLGQRLASQAAALSFRLPTEAEWEFACRAGTTTRFWSGDAESDLAWAGWYGANSNERSLPHADRHHRMQPVAQKPANPWGLHDMHGNVWEWCADWYDERPFQLSARTNPCCNDPASGWRVTRGGDAWDDAASCRSAAREHMNPDTSHNDTGFRVVADRLP